METQNELKPTHVLCSLYDTKSETFFAPQLFRNKEDFIRGIQVSAKDSTSMLHKFPSDYELFILGQWHETCGITSQNDVRLGSVLDLCPLN